MEVSLNPRQTEVLSRLQKRWARYGALPVLREFARDLNLHLSSLQAVLSTFARFRMLQKGVEAHHGLRLTTNTTAWAEFRVRLTPASTKMPVLYPAVPFEVSVRAPSAEVAACWATDMWRERHNVRWDHDNYYYDDLSDEAKRSIFSDIQVTLTKDIGQ